MKIDQIYQHPLLLSEIKELPLGECRLTAKGNRLSVIPITSEQSRIMKEAIERKNGNVVPIERSHSDVTITRQETQPLEVENGKESLKSQSKRVKKRKEVEVEESQTAPKRSSRRKTSNR